VISTSTVSRAAMAFGALLLVAPAPAAEHEWCGEERWDDAFCEVRELSLDGRPSLRIDATPNGGIDVRGADRGDIRLLAKVTGHGHDEADSAAIVSEVRILTERTIRAEGPSLGRGRHFSVSYRLEVPRRTDLDLVSHNGGIAVRDVAGSLRFETQNGGISLADLAGDVRGETRNGGVSVKLDGSRWDGRGLDVETRNGGVRLAVPEGYNAQLETGTVNGGVDVDFPVTVKGKIARHIETTLGSGGAPVRVVTTNGGVRVTRR